MINEQKRKGKIAEHISRNITILEVPARGGRKGHLTIASKTTGSDYKNTTVGVSWHNPNDTYIREAGIRLAKRRRKMKYYRLCFRGTPPNLGEFLQKLSAYEAFPEWVEEEWILS
jgi:hypothetical protein